MSGSFRRGVLTAVLLVITGVTLSACVVYDDRYPRHRGGYYGGSYGDSYRGDYRGDYRRY